MFLKCVLSERNEKRGIKISAAIKFQTEKFYVILLVAGALQISERA